jgi:pyruvate carboxylase
MLNPKKKYNLEYYLSVVDKIVAMGAHVLGVKDSKCIQFSRYTHIAC